MNTIEKAIRFEKFLQPNLKIENHQQLVDQLSRIGQKVSKDNNIAFSAFEGIFKDSNETTILFNLLRFEGKNNYQSGNTGIENN
ncbi:hypothetical protein [Chryseobacterium sp. SIMBA_029]|uniref:hypothetical protein n=1 Tax=Chryseobacterium sp. SIMBA_029 TaxID=3085772 RepID=UPI00397A3AC7